MAQPSTLTPTHAGDVPAPQNFRAVAKADNSVDTSWDPVSRDGVRYTLKEARNPDGLNNARNISETHSHRTPPVPDHGSVTYEYWVVAIRDGKESGDSAHQQVTLPLGAQPHEVQPGGTPAEILQLGGAGGHWELGIGPRHADASSVEDAFGHDGEVDDNGIMTVTEHGLLRGFAHARYFTPTSDGTAVTMTSFMKGAVRPNTSSGGSNFTRTELRELESDGRTKATWDAGDGRHVLSGRTAVLHMPPRKPKICVAQIHGTEDDTLELRIEGKTDTAAGGFRWVIHFSDGNVRHGHTDSIPKGDYALGDEVAWEIRVENRTVTVTLDGVEQFRESLSLPDQFFKTGCYTQTNADSDHGSNDPDEFESITLRDLRLHHDD